MDRSTLAARAATLGGAPPAAAPANNIGFDSGHAFPGVLPDLTDEAARALSQYRSETLQYAPRPGLPELRSQIVELMKGDGADVSTDHVLVTNGAKHAIDLICRLLLDPGDSIVVTIPTYFTAIPIFKSFGVRFIEVVQDEQGLDVADLGRNLEQLNAEGQPPPKFIYNVPDFHNPTGVTMSLERRRRLLEFADRYGIFVVEDSPYRRVRFEGTSVPPLVALDPTGRVLHVGTFAKLMAPGLRIGWVTGAPDLIARMIQLKSDGGSCPLTQRLIIEFLAAGKLPDHIRRVEGAYGANRDHMVRALRRELPEVTFAIPEGGYYLWVAFPSATDADGLARKASEGGVTTIPGSRFFARADVGHPRHFLRLAYSHATADEIDEGIRRLAAAYAPMARPSTVAAVT